MELRGLRTAAEMAEPRTAVEPLELRTAVEPMEARTAAVMLSQLRPCLEPASSRDHLMGFTRASSMEVKPAGGKSICPLLSLRNLRSLEPLATLWDWSRSFAQ